VKDWQAILLNLNPIEHAQAKLKEFDELDPEITFF